MGALLLVMLMLGAAQVPGGAVGGDRAGECRGPGPMADEPSPWTDPLDDLSHVYMPEGGLVYVEVASGEVRLKAEATEGWIASEVITCPPGYRYDLVYLEADVPGASRVQISVLNASKESSEIGFANETIPLHAKVNGTDHSVYDISPASFPAIRIQVNLVASGTDRPRLLAWSLYFLPEGEWRDDFLGTAKMSRWQGLNLTGGTLEVNLTRGGGMAASDYEAFPAIAVPGGDKVYLLYPNEEHAGYQDSTSLPAVQASGDVNFGELNGDGILDLLVLETSTEGSKVYWGSSSGTYSTTDVTELPTTAAVTSSIGDYNGNGWNDIIIDCQVGSTFAATIFYNNGDETFDSVAASSMDSDGVLVLRSGDINADGYDDIVTATGSAKCLYYCGPDGPGPTPDATFYDWPAVTQDLNNDGYCDIILINSTYNKISIMLGGPDGIGAARDYTLTGTFYAMDCLAGDVNGDGYTDIVVRGHTGVAPYPNFIYVYEGKADDWDTSTYHAVITGIDNTGSDIEVADVDKDGCDDILFTLYSGTGTAYSLKIFLGSASWPSSPPDITQDVSLGSAWIILAIPRVRNDVKLLMGTFTTTPIDLPAGKKWDILHVYGDFPKNTSMKMSILDASGKKIQGYDGLIGTDVDMSGISEQSVKVKITLASEFNTTTPVLDRLTVRYMDRGTWREQFYGGAKVERMLNLGVVSGELARTVSMGSGPQLLIPGLRGPTGYDVRPQAYLDGGGLDYAALPPIPFEARGVSASEAADVNGDGFMDVAFAVRQTGDAVYTGQSPLFLGSAGGWKVTPDHLFPTTGASDVLLRDLNGDGSLDAVFAQEYDGTAYRVNSTLFWGKAGGGWNSTPDVQFATNGASGLATADLDGDGDLDLAFACFRDQSSTATDSMVFLQDATGFCGTVPSHRLPTKGARAVGAGDVNKDGRIDLAFANSVSGGSVEIDSYVYLGRAGGGFEATPKALRTSGAEDVALADVDGDLDLDVVFANMRNNVANYKLDSFMFLNDGTGNFPATPSVRLPTTGAVAVAVADIDGTGRKDLVFACQYNGTSYMVSSVVFLGGTSGWSTSPDIVLPTVGASDVLVAHLLKAGVGGYVSKAITPENVGDTGAFHTFRYTARLGAQQSGMVQLIDAVTWATLAETPLQAGTQEWVVKDLFWVKEHPSVRAVVTVTGLGQPGEFAVDDLSLNWTKRVKLPPQVLGLEVRPSSILRLDRGEVVVTVSDEYDPVLAMRPLVEHRLNGSTDSWVSSMLGATSYSPSDGTWRATVFPKVDVRNGTYDFRVSVKDSDSLSSGYIYFPNALEVRNNVPTAPVVRIMPQSPTTALTLRVEIVTPATDRETPISYHHQWYCDGTIVGTLTSDTVPSALTERGQNWSVEVRAFDGLDEGLPGIAWTVIVNAPPQTRTPLPNPEIAEDKLDDQWLDLSKAFEDPDGDALTYSLAAQLEHIHVAIDPSGKVTLRPDANWSGQESATFVATDGMLSASQTVLVTVTPVNDAPWFVTVNGGPITTDPIALSVNQGERLVITVGATDVEGDELVLSVNTTAVTVDEVTGTITFEPGNEAVGTLRFALTMYDIASPDVKVRLNFVLTVVNVNDPMDAPRITSPKAGAKYKTNVTFSLIGACTDPDTVLGQVLNYTWWWNGTHLIGYGSSLTWNFTEPGTYVITLNVTDGEFSKETSVEVTIEPKDIPGPPLPPDGDDGDEDGIGTIAVIGILVVLIIIGGVIFLVMSKRREEAKEAEEEAQEKREAIKHMADEVRATADEMEREVREARAAEPKPAEVTKVVIETRGADGQVVVSSTGVQEQTLAVQPKETEAPSADVAKLFKEMEKQGAAGPSQDQEQLRIENLTRKYQTAIGRLPYGIPAAELKGRDWNELAAALATGQKKETPDGRELTLIEGRWYFSDVKDASSFLTEHGARPKAEPKKAAAVPMTDKAVLLAKLEERFILGEISEAQYEDLKKKLTQ